VIGSVETQPNTSTEIMNDAPTQMQCVTMLVVLIISLSGFWISIQLGLEINELVKAFRNPAWAPSSTLILIAVAKLLQDYAIIVVGLLLLVFHYWVRKKVRRMLWFNGLLCILMLGSMVFAISARLAMIEKFRSQQLNGEL
jgi:hypothetical protein